MIGATISQRGTTLIQRLLLDPGMATPWHVDPIIASRSSSGVKRSQSNTVTDAPPTRVEVVPGLTEWDAPTELVPRAVNVGSGTYEQVTIYFLDRSDAVAQPVVE